MNRRFSPLLCFALALSLGCKPKAPAAAAAASPASAPSAAAGSATEQRPSAKGNPMANRPPFDPTLLFDLLRELAKEHDFRAAGLAERLGLTFIPERENPYFRFFEAKGPAKKFDAIASAELREAAQVAAQGPQVGLLSLSIDPGLCIGEADVRTYFGASPELSIPSPHAPPELPLYWVYRQDGCKLSLGFSRRPPSCLVAVTLDSIPGS